MDKNITLKQIRRIDNRKGLLDLWRVYLSYNFTTFAGNIEDKINEANHDFRELLDDAVKDGDITKDEKYIFEGAMGDTVKTNALLYWSCVDKPREDYEGFFERIEKDGKAMDSLAKSITDDYKRNHI
jgi:hypothetical protein